MPPSLAQWQWQGYPRNHQSRANLLIHIATWPPFIAGNVGLIVHAVRAEPGLWLFSFATMVVAFALQGIGHKRETNAPEPFSGPANFFGRVFLEQWVTFPRFVLSGGWLRAWRAAEPAA
jgi:hypothetical protein